MYEDKHEMTRALLRMTLFLLLATQLHHLARKVMRNFMKVSYSTLGGSTVDGPRMSLSSVRMKDGNVSMGAADPPIHISIYS